MDKEKVNLKYEFFTLVDLLSSYTNCFFEMLLLREKMFSIIMGKYRFKAVPELN